ncbi:MAG: SCO family protein [Acidobacteriota bacterium]|nr:SCO family protein [Acidobacteriota bacterium]MDH3784040.1 SCO family protein [Acidobacteriota bacterium]
MRFLLAIAILCSVLSPVMAQVAGEIPPHLRSVDVDEKLDQLVPLNAQFVDERGRPVQLGDYFEDERPVVLVMAYYRCPMLCSLVLDGLVDVLGDLEGQPGKDYQILTVSIDPTESPTLAQSKRQTYLRALGRPGADEGWHFLTGRKEQIDAVADAIGFRYRYVEDRGEYAHPALLTVLTPEGKISRYLYGVKWEPDTVRLSLVEASNGAIGTTVERILLSCYGYDATEGRYGPVAMKIMRTGGVLTVIVFGLVLISFWLRERSGAKRTPPVPITLGERNV